jgi:hypothetical protein
MAVLGMAAGAHCKSPDMVLRFDPVGYIFIKERRKNAVDGHLVEARYNTIDVGMAQWLF